MASVDTPSRDTIPVPLKEILSGKKLMNSRDVKKGHFHEQSQGTREYIKKALFKKVYKTEEALKRNNTGVLCCL
jgi:hypothetical protein